MVSIIFLAVKAGLEYIDYCLINFDEIMSTHIETAQLGLFFVSESSNI